MKENIDTEVFNRVVAYLGQHLSGRVTIETICKDNLIGRSQLQKIFSKKSGLGIIEYFSNMKIEAAKELIRTEQMNFTQISEKLGYTSIHYFSRQFKNGNRNDTFRVRLIHQGHGRPEPSPAAGSGFGMIYTDLT